MGKYAIGVDFGSLSGRAVLVDVGNGRQIAECVVEYPHGVMSATLAASGEKLPPDTALQDAADYEKVLETAIPAVIAEGKIERSDVIGIGVDFTTCTLLPAKKDGTPLSYLEEYRRSPHAYVKLWKHHGAAKYAEKLSAVARERGEKWLSRFGGEISSEWAFPKIWQVLAEAEDVYRAADVFLEAGDWVTWRLTGTLTRGYAYAAAKSMYLPEEGGYPSEDFFAALDGRLTHVVREKLGGRIVPSDAAAGTVSAGAAERYGLPAGIPCACPQPDAHTATVSLGLKKPGEMCGILGTSACFMLLSDEEKTVPGICGTLKDSMTPGFYGYEAGLCCFGDHFAWVEEKIARKEDREEAAARGISVTALLMEKAAKKKPGETGLLALNWFNGNRSTLIDDTRSGMILGMTLHTAPEDIMRALAEATAFGTRVIFENYRAHGVPVRRFVAAGGIARKNPFLMQLFADVLKTDVEVPDTAEAPALSGAIRAAALAGRAAGGYDSLSDAMDAMCGKCDRVYHPRAAEGEIYDKLYAEYETLYRYFGRENDVMRRLRALGGERI